MIDQKKLYIDEFWPLLRLKGKGTRKFLNGQTTSNLLSQAENIIHATCLLNPLGKLRAILEIKFDNEGADIIVLNGDIKNVYKDFEKVIFPADMVEIQSSNSIRRIQMIDSSGSRFSQVIWLSDQQKLPKELDSFTPATKEELQMWRVKQGLFFEIDKNNQDINPFELGYSELIDLDKGCYLGQEVIAKLVRSTSLKMQLRVWESAAIKKKGQLIFKRVGSKLSERNVGLILSNFYSNKDRSFSGLALIRSSSLDEKVLYCSDNHPLMITFPIDFNLPYH